VSPGAGGLATSAPTIARFIGDHAVWDLGGRRVATRYGDFAGTSAIAHSRADGIDLAVTFNHRVSDATKNSLVAQLEGILGTWAALI